MIVIDSEMLKPYVGNDLHSKEKCWPFYSSIFYKSPLSRLATPNNVQLSLAGIFYLKHCQNNYIVS